MFAGSQTSPCAASAQTAATAPMSMPRIAAIDADSHGHGFLHVFAAIAHGANGIGEADGARGHMRGIFAEAVSGDE